MQKPMFDPIKRLKNQTPEWEALLDIALYNHANSIAIGRRPTRFIKKWTRRPIQPKFPPDEDNMPPEDGVKART